MTLKLSRDRSNQYLSEDRFKLLLRLGLNRGLHLSSITSGRLRQRLTILTQIGQLWI
jgi:hypothetical protein